MNIKYFIGIMVIIATAALTGCGGGGGGGADPNAPATIDMTASKTVALANGSDAVTIQAAVKKADGSSVADGTIVTFSVATATLTATSAATTNGTASVSVTCAPVSGANNFMATVLAAAGGATGSRDVKFISQPTSVDVSVSFDTAVTDLAALQFILKNTAGASFDNNTQLVSRINNAAAGSTSIIFAGFNAGAGSLTIGLANPNGFDTGTTPIIKATFAVTAGAGLPTFSIESTPGSFTATNLGNNATTPPVTAANMVVSTAFNTE